MVKKCVRPQCGIVYSMSEERKFCDCGALLVNTNGASDKKNTQAQQRHSRANAKKAQLVLLLDDDKEVVFKLNQSNVIGLLTDNNKVDIDLSAYASREYISRRHAKIYSEDGTYYISKMTKKHAVHVNEKAVADKPIKLISGDMVLLSKKLVFQFEEV